VDEGTCSHDIIQVMSYELRQMLAMKYELKEVLYNVYE